MNHNFPTIEEIVAMQDSLIEKFGGAVGIRDEGALAAAVMRPQLGYYETLVEEADALMESLAINHAFIDGNKRAAFFATESFLRANGYFIDCDDEEAFETFVTLFETHSFRFKELAVWLKEKVMPLREE